MSFDLTIYRLISIAEACLSQFSIGNLQSESPARSALVLRACRQKCLYCWANILSRDSERVRVREKSASQLERYLMCLHCQQTNKANSKNKKKNQRTFQVFFFSSLSICFAHFIALSWRSSSAIHLRSISSLAFPSIPFVLPSLSSSDDVVMFFSFLFVFCSLFCVPFPLEFKCQRTWKWTGPPGCFTCYSLCHSSASSFFFSHVICIFIATAKSNASHQSKTCGMSSKLDVMFCFN